MTGSLAGLVHAARRLTPRRGQGGGQLARLCSAGRAISAFPVGSPADSVHQSVPPVCPCSGYIPVTSLALTGSLPGLLGGTARE